MSEEKEFELRPNGKVWFKVGETEYLCRRPTVGDLAKILELNAEIGDKEREALKAKPTVGKQNMLVTELLSQWAHDALGMLLEKGSMPAVADLPSWAASPQLPPSLITHWQSVPLAPSGK